MRPETCPESEAILNNMLSIIIDPGKLIDDDFYRSELDAAMKWVKASKPIDPAHPVLVPGEPEQIMKRKRESDGIPIDDTTWEEILGAGDLVGFGRDAIVALITAPAP